MCGNILNWMSVKKIKNIYNILTILYTDKIHVTHKEDLNVYTTK